MLILLKKYINIGVFIILKLIYSIVRTQQVKCYQYSDCSTDQCCIEGFCSKPINDQTKSSCKSNKVCYSKTCQYGCCNDSNECGTYDNCQTSQKNAQISISVAVGVIVLILLLCYIIYSWRKSKRIEIQNTNEESQSNIQNNDGTFINQTNNNQTQLNILNQNPNQTNITEYNQNNNTSSIVSRPTHVLLPIQTIFLVDQQQEKTNNAEKKLKSNQVGQITQQSNKTQKDNCNHKNNNKSLQGTNYPNQYDVFQYNQEQITPQEIQDVQHASFNIRESLNENQLRNQQASQQQQNKEINNKQDLLKSPENFLKQILRSLKEQVFIQKFIRNNQENRQIEQNDSRQLRSESDINEQNISQKQKSFSLHHKLSERSQYKKDIEDQNNIKQQYDQQDQCQIKDTFKNKSQQNTKDDKIIKNEQVQYIKKQSLKNGNMSSIYEQEIQLNRNAFNQYQEQQQLQLNNTINIENKDKIISSNRNQNDMFDQQRRQQNNNNDIQDSPFQIHSMMTPHTPNEQSDRQLNLTNTQTQNYTNQNSHNQINSSNQHFSSYDNINEQDLSSIQSNNQQSVLKNQNKDEQNYHNKAAIEKEIEYDNQQYQIQQIENQIDQQNKYQYKQNKQIKQENIKNLNVHQNEVNDIQNQIHNKTTNDNENTQKSQNTEQDDYNLQIQQQNVMNEQIQNI